MAHTADWLGPGHARTRSIEEAPAAKGLLGQLKSEAGAVLLGSKLNLLLLPLPLALAAQRAGWPAGAAFVLALLPLCSLAERLGMITEQIAMYTNDSIGGLLNATFGNATELIIAGFAIKKGYLRVVKLTLLGSIVSNLLLVMGSAFIAGGARHQMQHFNVRGINVNCALLILSVVSIALPTLLSSTSDVVTGADPELALSRFESVLLLLGYATFLVFQLVTHRFLYEGDLSAGEAPSKASVTAAAAAAAAANGSGRPPRSQQERRQSGGGGGDLELSTLERSECGLRRGGGGGSGGHYGAGRPPLPPGGGGGGGVLTSRSGSRADLRIEVAAEDAEAAWASSRAAAAAAARFQAEGDGWAAESESPGPFGERASLMGGARVSAAVAEIQEEEEEECVLSLWGALFWLALVTVFISLLSDVIMDVINAASRQLKVPMPFLTTIVVPIVGNAAEHASALMFAMKNRMEVALGVAVGSSTQVGVLIIPVCIILAWAMGQPLDLNFNEFEAAVLFISVLLAVVVLQDGSSNYLKGLLLVLTYCFISAGFWLHKDPLLQEAIDEGGHPR